MEKHITYTEKELKAKLDFMRSSARHLLSYIKMMEEQANGERSNLDMSIYSEILPDVLNIQRCIEDFNCA